MGNIWRWEKFLWLYQPQVIFAFLSNFSATFEQISSTIKSTFPKKKKVDLCNFVRFAGLLSNIRTGNRQRWQDSCLCQFIFHEQIWMFRKNIAFNKRLCEHIWEVPFQMRPSSPGFEPREGSSNLPKTFTFKIYIYLRNCSSIFCLFAVHLLLSWPYYLHLVLWLYFHLFVTSYTYVIFLLPFLMISFDSLSFHHLSILLIHHSI